ncbi:MAG: DUF4864 domain-containing protein [Polaromonas sp.]|uniref:DUF4864 domain-containing protein n=1 Tax=Polaromonas sp. TaxID=1869339 RepID=UPI0032645E57
MTARLIRLNLVMRMTRRIAAGCAALWLLGAAVPVSAAPLTAADEKNVGAVVQAQLDAFRKDDAVKAFSFAAPNVRQAVGTAKGFMTMVRRDYPVVYRPASVAFLNPEGKDGQAIQRVQMTDGNGVSWLAVYSLERQSNKAWRITGCVVAENKGRMASRTPSGFDVLPVSLAA